jgi:hypothetical protein
MKETLNLEAQQKGRGKKKWKIWKIRSTYYFKQFPRTQMRRQGLQKRSYEG